MPDFIIKFIGRRDGKRINILLHQVSNTNKVEKKGNGNGNAYIDYLLSFG